MHVGVSRPVPPGDRANLRNLTIQPRVGDRGMCRMRGMRDLPRSRRRCSVGRLCMPAPRDPSPGTTRPILQVPAVQNPARHPPHPGETSSPPQVPPLKRRRTSTTRQRSATTPLGMDAQRNRPHGRRAQRDPENRYCRRASARADASAVPITWLAARSRSLRRWLARMRPGATGMGDARLRTRRPGRRV